MISGIGTPSLCMYACAYLVQNLGCGHLYERHRQNPGREIRIMANFAHQSDTFSRLTYLASTTGTDLEVLVVLRRMRVEWVLY